LREKPYKIKLISLNNKLKNANKIIVNIDQRYNKRMMKNNKK